MLAASCTTVHSGALSYMLMHANSSMLRVTILTCCFSRSAEADGDALGLFVINQSTRQSKILMMVLKETSWDHQSYFCSSWGEHGKVCRNFMAIHPIAVKVFHYIGFWGWPKSLGYILWGQWQSARNAMIISHIFVEIFQSGLKLWTEQLAQPSPEACC